MNRCIVFRPDAWADLAAIADFLAADNPGRARRVVAGLRRRCEILLAHPLVGRPRDAFGAGVRSLSHRPYVIFYRLNGEDIEILAIIHAARDLPNVLGTRLGQDRD
ncbi:MAG: type II toxin-antitoxin system RelE/ParE family toxin [Terricaulis sp.]